MRRGALRSALSERLREGNIIVIDEFGFANPRTKDFLVAADSLGLVENKKRAKTLVIDSLDNENLVLSTRNVEKTKVTNSFGLNIYDIIYHERLLISKAAIEELNELLDPNREGTKGEAEEGTAEAVTLTEKPKAAKKAKAASDDASEKPVKAKKEAKPKAEKEEKVEAEKPAKAPRKAKAEAEEGTAEAVTLTEEEATENE
jgi:hypothetical protein